MERKLYTYITLAFLSLAVVMTSCDDDAEESMSWRPGNGLHIIGSDEVLVGSTSSYRIDGHTIKESYAWSVNNAAVITTSDEFVSLDFPLGTHALTVSNGKYTGTMSVTAISKELGFVSDSIRVVELAENDTVAIALDLGEVFSQTTIAYEIKGTAVQGVDYELLSPNPLVLTEDSDDEDKAIMIKLLPDAAIDNADSVFVEITSVTTALANETVLADEELLWSSVHIVDDLATVQFADTTTVDVEEPQIVVVGVTLSSPSMVPVTVNYSFTALAGVSDVTPTGAGSLTFEPGETEKQISLSFAPAAFTASSTVTLTLNSLTGTNAEAGLHATLAEKEFSVIEID